MIELECIHKSIKMKLYLSQNHISTESYNGINNGTGLDINMLNHDKAGSCIYIQNIMNQAKVGYEYNEVIIEARDHIYMD